MVKWTRSHFLRMSIRSSLFAINNSNIRDSDDDVKFFHRIHILRTNLTANDCLTQPTPHREGSPQYDVNDIQLGRRSHIFCNAPSTNDDAAQLNTSLNSSGESDGNDSAQSQFIGPSYVIDEELLAPGHSSQVRITPPKVGTRLITWFRRLLS